MPKTCGLLQQYRCSCLFSVIGLHSEKKHIYVCDLRVHTLSEGGAKPTQELMILSRRRRRDMVRPSDSGVGSSTSDAVRLVSMPATRSPAVFPCPVRIGGKVRSLRICSELRCGETNSKTMSARPRTNHREWPGHVSVTHQTFHIWCLRLRLANLTWA